MERLKCMFTRVLFILIKWKFEYYSSVETYKEQIFFRSDQKTSNSAFKLVQRKLSITLYVKILRFFWFSILVHINKAIWASNYENFVWIWKCNYCLYCVILAWTAGENSFELSINCKIKQLSVVSTYNKALFEYTIRCKVEIFFVDLSPRKRRIFDLQLISAYFEKL